MLGAAHAHGPHSPRCMSYGYCSVFSTADACAALCVNSHAHGHSLVHGQVRFYCFHCVCVQLRLCASVVSSVAGACVGLEKYCSHGGLPGVLWVPDYRVPRSLGLTQL
jgi:hypothetical protein